jgi:hypothetical protein
VNDRLREAFRWNDGYPEKVGIFGPAPYLRWSVSLDYGWADRILCTGSYYDDARAIAMIVADVCGCEFDDPGEEEPRDADRVDRARG